MGLQTCFLPRAPSNLGTPLAQFSNVVEIANMKSEVIDNANLIEIEKRT